MERMKLGFAMTGSFCTFEANLALMGELAGMYELVPILSFNAAGLDT